MSPILISLILTCLIIESILDNSSLLSFYSPDQQDDYANVSSSATYVTLGNPNAEMLPKDSRDNKEDAAGRYEMLVTLTGAAENEQAIYVKPFN